MFSYHYNALRKIFSSFFSHSIKYVNPTHFLRNTHEFIPSFSKSTFNLFSTQCYGSRLYSLIPSHVKHQPILPFQYFIAAI